MHNSNSFLGSNLWWQSKFKSANIMGNKN